MSLADQIAAAQAEMSTWPPERVAACQLQGDAAKAQPDQQTNLEA